MKIPAMTCIYGLYVQCTLYVAEYITLALKCIAVQVVEDNFLCLHNGSCYIRSKFASVFKQSVVKKIFTIVDIK
jgi:hypothetical protein